MNQNTGFWQTFKTAATDFSHYNDFLSRSFWSAVKYLYLLLLFLSVITVLKSAIPLIPQMSKIDSVVKNIRQIIDTSYPQELVVEIKNGQLSTNVPEPYYIDLPKEISDEKPTDFHLITIDTQATVEDFSQLKTGVLVTKTAIVTYDDDKALKVYPFKPDFNFTVDKNKYNDLTGKISPYLNFAKPLVIGFTAAFFILGPFFLAGFGLSGKLIGHLIWVLIFFIIAKVLSKNLGYKQIYKLSLFGVTLPVIISTLQSLINIPWSSIVQTQTSSTVPLIAMIARNYHQISNLVFFIVMIYALIKFETPRTTAAPTNSITPQSNPQPKL